MKFGRLFQARVQPLEETIGELQDIVKEANEAEQCIWYSVMKKDTSIDERDRAYHCRGCKGDNKDCRGYVPLDFYKK